MLQAIGALRKSSFVRQNAVFFAGSVLIGAANYLYYPILGRLLDPIAFGDVQALMALYMQLALLLTVLSQVSVNVAANYQDKTKQLKTLFELEKLALQLSVGMVVILALLSFKLRSFLQLSSVWPFIILLVAILAGVPATFRGAYLRANQAFGHASISQIIGATGKILFSALLVLAGFHAAGAIGGLVLAQILALYYAAFFARKHGFMRPRGSSYRTRLDLATLAPELRYAGLVLACSLAITVLASIDILVAKHYFSPQIAGEYAGISTVAKIVYYLTGSVAQVMLPAIKLRNTSKQNQALLVKSLVILTALGGTATAIFAVINHTVVRVLMGSEYLPFAGVLPSLAAAMFVISIINMLVIYHVALRRYQIGLVMLGATAVTSLLLVLHHDTPAHMVNSLLVGSVLSVAGIAIWQYFVPQPRGAGN